MFRFRNYFTVSIGAVILSAASIFGITQSATARPLVANTAPVESTSSSPIPNQAPAIAIPMVSVPHTKSSADGVHPNIVIPENCGTAFLYASNGHNHVHYDFGFVYLNNATFWVNAHIGASNLDYGEVDANSFGGAYIGSSWEKQGNLYAGSGENLVTAHIYAFGPIYDCESSPLLQDDFYVG